MKRFGVFVAALVVASPTMAWVKVTNLSGQPQSVTYSHAGSAATRTIAPSATEYFTAGDGMLALNGAEAIQKARQAASGPAGRMFGDMVAANRTSNIPAKNGSHFVIWPDGRLLIQRYRGGTGNIF